MSVPPELRVPQSADADCPRREVACRHCRGFGIEGTADEWLAITDAIEQRKPREFARAAPAGRLRHVTITASVAL